MKNIEHIEQTMRIGKLQEKVKELGANQQEELSFLEENSNLKRKLKASQEFYEKDLQLLKNEREELVEQLKRQEIDNIATSLENQ